MQNPQQATLRGRTPGADFFGRKSMYRSDPITRVTMRRGVRRQDSRIVSLRHSLDPDGTAIRSSPAPTGKESSAGGMRE
jgi:hypothetical protein